MKFRLEDTNREKWKQEYEDNIVESMDLFLGIKVTLRIRQSERAEVYKKYILQLIESGRAYISKEEPKGAGERCEVIRFKNPNLKVKFNDLILGDIETDTTDLGDFVIAKDTNSALYHLTVVVDDHEMGVTHVIRGQDHIANTARQILIQEAIGATRPLYAHIPLILAPDKTKLSKRHGATSVADYIVEGYIPNALVNFLSLTGWNPGGEQEIFSLEELIKIFRLDNVQKSGGVFDIVKLNWMNREYIKKMADDDFLVKVLEFLPESFKNSEFFSLERLKGILPIIKNRTSKFGDITELALGTELKYFFEAPRYARELLKNQEFFTDLAVIIEKISEEDFRALKIKEAIWDFATEKGRGKVLWPMRVALSGLEKSPDPFLLAEILGKDETISRLKYAKDL